MALNMRELDAKELRESEALTPLLEEVKAFHENGDTLFFMDIPAARETWWRLITMGLAVAIVVEDDDVPVGMTIGICGPELTCYRLVASRGLIFVTEGRRGEKIGSLLTDAFEIWAKSAGASKIVVGHQVNKMDANMAQSIFVQKGYKPCEVSFEKEVV